MKSQHVLIAGVVVIALGGGVWYFSQGSDPSGAADMAGQDTAQIDTEEATQNEELAGVGSFESLLGLGQDISCEYNYADDEGNTGSGEGYFSGGQMRVNSEMTTADGTVYNSHIISDGETMYTWSESAEGTYAMKMSVTEYDEAPADFEASAETGGEVSMDQEVEYDCESWNAVASVFVPPADIEFTDMGAMMQQMMQGMPEGFEMPEGYIAQ